MSHAGRSARANAHLDTARALALATDIGAYRQFVKGIASGELRSQVILNRTADHAAVVLCEIFAGARSAVHILARDLNVYNNADVCRAAANFLQVHTHGEVHVLVEQETDPSNAPFLIEMNNVDPRRTRFHHVPNAVQQTYNFSFAVADAESYRFQDDRENYEASIRFRDREFGGQLEDAFQRLLTLIQAAA